MRLRPMRLRPMWLRPMWLRAMRLRAMRLRPAAATCGDRTPDREARIYRAPVHGRLLSGAELWLPAAPICFSPVCEPACVPVCVRTATSVPLRIWRRAGAATLWILSISALAMVSGHHRYRAALLRMPAAMHPAAAVLAKCPPPANGRGRVDYSSYRQGRRCRAANVDNSLRLVTS